MANLIRVIGVGPGNPDYITPEAQKMIAAADVLVGGERLLRDFAEPGKAQYIIRNNLPEMVEFINLHRQHSTVAVLASGDPTFYGITEFLKKHFAPAELLVCPGLSSVQLACARLCISWHDSALYSVHGRSIEGLVNLVRHNKKVIVLTDPKHTPGLIAGELALAGIRDRRMYVCENLSYADERTGEYNLHEIPADVGKSGCVVVITDE
ncbi:MAG: precorrin-6y C5,15-methyltransferase (decarboxylating) subunit CbiE [Thermincola sp.]|nr:precorrin-6y C5,15-methyltransferase (decarboxylating) subunit CbiE [Thermincola sp.]MDT3703591.1 precorrin-6y C5,15-methyltransferase (decarboxylating) subunit CbiE [Thermincola sp.]